MCSDFKLLDSVSLQNKLSVNHALDCSQDNRYCIVAEDGLYFFQLCGIMDNILPTASLKKLFLKIPYFAVSSHLGIDINSFITELPQFELYEAVLRLDISEELSAGASIKQQPIQAKWSPVGLIGNAQCAVASLTNTGTLFIFIRTINEAESEEYIVVTNISQLCIDHFKTSWTNVTKSTPSATFSELKRRAGEVILTAFTWSHLMTVDGKEFCLFIVGHLNGGISVWKFDKRNANDLTKYDVSLMGYCMTELKKISALHWQQAGRNGLLIIGDIEGKVKAVCVKNITSNSVEFGSDLYLWNEVDHIKIEHFKIFTSNNMIFVLIVKGSFLLVCLLGESGTLLDVHSFHVGNFHITGIEHFEENIFLVLTYTGVLKELKLFCENNKIRIEWRPLYIDCKWSSYRTHGLIVSPNKVFCAVLISICKLKDIKKSKDPIRLLIFMNMGKDPLAVLMKNTTDSLTNYWDCLEILRLDGLIEKKLPCDGLPAGLDYDKLSLIQLKTCLWLAKSSEMMYNKMYTLEEYNILRYDDFKYIIKLKLAIDHMHHLLELIADGTELSEFHMQTLDILNMYLKESVSYNAIPSLGLGKNTIDELYDVISAANELEYPPPPKCMWCKESIIGLSCVPPHMDSRCTISFMPIIGLPYYKCPFCASIVHSRLNEVYSTVLCPLCDVPLDLVSFIKGLDNGESVVAIPVTEANYNEISTCNSDCLNEEVPLTDIEDHAFVEVEKKGKHVNLVWVSSSDDDSDSKADESMELVVEGSNVK